VFDGKAMTPDGWLATHHPRIDGDTPEQSACIHGFPLMAE
jgi:hypothetical protein